MSDTPGAVREFVLEHTVEHGESKLSHVVGPLIAFADAHDVEDARRDADVQELWRVESQTAGQNERLRTALRLLDDAWTNSDIHPRHAPKTCQACDRVYAAIDTLGMWNWRESDDYQGV